MPYLSRSIPHALYCLTLLFLLLAVPSKAALLENSVHETVLDNGLRLLMVERHASPTVTAYITFGVGAVDETSRQRGVAHLLEHMLFKGTKTIGTTDFDKEKEVLRKIEQTGERLDRLSQSDQADQEEIRRLEERLEKLQQRHKDFVVKDEFSRIYSENGGVGYNAFTSKDLTTYTISLPANKLELWAALESDRWNNAVLREFYTEREVVREERRRSYESNPRGMLYERLLATAFTVHPYRNPIIGWDSDIATLSLDETRRFFHKYYAPANMVIALVGAIDPSEAENLVRRYFGHMDPGTAVSPVTAKEPPQREQKRTRIYFDAEEQLAMAFHKPTLPHRDDYVFDLIDQLLSQGRTSRLYRSLVVEKQLAASVNTYVAPGARYPNLFVVSAKPRHPHTAAEVEDAIDEELEKLAREPVSEKALEKARVQLRTAKMRRMKDNSNLARMLTYYQVVADDWHYLVEYDQNIATVTAEEIMDVARRYLTPENRTVTVIGRKDSM